MNDVLHDHPSSVSGREFHIISSVHVVSRVTVSPYRFPSPSCSSVVHCRSPSSPSFSLPRHDPRPLTRLVGGDPYPPSCAEVEPVSTPRPFSLPKKSFPTRDVELFSTYVALSSLFSFFFRSGLPVCPEVTTVFRDRSVGWVLASRPPLST